MSSNLENQINSNADILNADLQTQTAIQPSDSESIHYDGKHYDLIYENFYPFPNLTSFDLPFWADMASQYGDPILELGCGTGRIALPLTEKKLRVTGIDISDSMLNQAREKSSQVEWIKSDIRNFDLGKQFSLIIFPLNSIYHLLTLDDLESCLSCVKKHLSVEGRFVIDTTNYYTQYGMEAMWSHSPILYSIYPDPDGKGTVIVTAVNQFDLTEQIATTKLFFQLLGQKEQFVEEIKLRLYHSNELEMLLKYNGFTVESKLGSYDKAPFNSKSPNHITICKLQN